MKADVVATVAFFDGTATIGGFVGSFSDSTVTELTNVTKKIATGTTDENVDFAGVTTASYLFVKSDWDITLKLNGDTNGFTTNMLVLSGGNVTSLKISNSSGNVATVQIILGEVQ